MPQGSFMRSIQDRGKLVAGVSQDILLFGYQNPISNQLEGFDIDMIKQVARAIFGDENHVEYRAITNAQRIPLLQDNTVDIVALTMTINCERWKQIDFSSVYYDAGQKVLVRRDSTAHRPERGCAGSWAICRKAACCSAWSPRSAPGRGRTRRSRRFACSPARGSTHSCC